jgi:hypothetical protein
LSAETKARLDAKGLLNKTPTSLAQLRDISHILSQSENSETERIGGAAIEGSLGRLATLYQDQEMTKANVGAAGLMGLAAHGFATSSDLAGVGNTLSEGGKNKAYAQAVVSQAQQLGVRSRPDIKAGYGIAIDEKGNFVDGMKSVADGGAGRADALLDTLNSSDLAGAKGGAMKALEPTIRARIESTDPARSRAQKDQLYQWAGRYSQASNDVKMQALNMIKEYGLEAEFNKVNDPTAGMSPAQIAALQAAGIDPNQFQQGNQGGPQGQ